MFYLKACSKCHGDLTLEKDAHGDYLKCMQCGTYTDVAVEVESGARSLYSPLNEAGVPALNRAQAETVAAA